jgi:hypothetical protein
LLVPTSHYRLLAIEAVGWLFRHSLPATPACEDLPLLRRTPAALAQLNR